MTGYVLVLAIAFGSVSVARADDGPAGTWKWQQTFNNNTRDVTLKLKQEGEKLTGTISGRQNNLEITDGTFKDGKVTFTVTREIQGRKIVTKYNGKLEKDTIKGEAEFDVNGQTGKRDWEAKREKS